MYSYNLTEEDKKILDVLIFNDISSNELIRYADDAMYQAKRIRP